VLNGEKGGGNFDTDCNSCYNTPLVTNCTQ